MVMEKYCSYCSSKIFDKDRTCPQCGAPVKNTNKKTQLEESYDDYLNNQIVALALEGGDFSLKRGNTRYLSIYAIRRNGIPFLIPSSLLQFQINCVDEKGMFEFLKRPMEIHEDYNLASYAYATGRSKGKYEVSVVFLDNPEVEMRFKATIY
jgi:DNA-directed RNA polymerase subunit RPC12/RpoP